MARSVLVTGAARRLGRAIAETLADQGWRVLVHARRADDGEGRAVAEALNGLFLSGDLAERDADRLLFQEAIRQAPDLCAIVNNASVFSLAADLPAHEARALWHVNVEVPLRLTDLLHDHLRDRTCLRPSHDDGPSSLEEQVCAGAVVDLLDTRILPPVPGTLTPYSAAKLALAESLVSRARQYAGFLRVNAVAPGPVMKPSQPCCREAGGRTLLPKRPTAADVAAAVAYLLTAKSVTGQVLAVDSGQSLLRVSAK